MSDEARNTHLDWLDEALEQNMDYETWLEERIAKLEAEHSALKRYAKTLPDKLKWIADNASHHSSHWLHTQLYGMAKELEYGYVNMGTKDFYKVNALLKGKDEKK